jgi:spermidine/putrescine ABC transporter ATP-binding subunit
MKEPVSLKLVDISKSFGSVQAVAPMNMEIAAGELVALLGPSGCGKTTTLRIIAGFEAPDTGAVVIGDRDVTGLAPNQRELGMVFQNYGLFPHMTVGENVAFGLKMRGVSRHERDRRAREMLSVVRLSNHEDRFSHQLSGGQQQRVALARSLVTSPLVLLLDEPLGALDKNLREGMQFELRELQRRMGITTVLVTHDQEEALTMADRIAVMNAGEVVQIGDPTSIYQRPETRFVSEFLGTSNVFDCTAENEIEPGIWSVRLAGGGLAPASCSSKLKPGTRALLAVRPERIAIVPEESGLMTAQVQDRVFRGSYYAYELGVPGRTDPIFAYQQASDVDSGVLGTSGAVGLNWMARSAVMLLDVNQ